MAENDGVSSRKGATRPTIALPVRASIETMLGSGGFGFGVSPGPMTLVSSFFSDTDPESECRSFSQLLAGAVTSPARDPTRVAADFGFTGLPGLFPGQVLLIR